MLRLWLIVILGATLRLATLGRQNLWLDEGFSYWVAKRPWLELVALLPSVDSHPPLFYLALRPMIAFGGSEWLLRLPSALAGIVSIGLLYALGVELFDHQTGLLAALILAVSPLHIWYAQEARMYALVASLTLAAGLFGLRGIRLNRSIDWMMFGICQGLALWVDVAALWFVLAIIGAALLTIVPLWRAGRFLPLVLAQGLAFVIYLPWVPSFLQQLRGGVTTWIPPATLRVVALTLTHFVGGYERPLVEVLLALLLLLLGLVVGAHSLFQEARIEWLHYSFLICWLFIPVVLAFMISQPYVRLPLLSLVFEPGRSVFLTRNLIVATFPLYVLLARGLALASRPVLVCWLGALIALNGFADYSNAVEVKKDDYRAVAAIITAHVTENDLIVFTYPSLELPFAYYYNPEKNASLPFEERRDGAIVPRGDRPVAPSIEALGDYHRIWLIMNHNAYQPDTLGVLAALERTGQLRASWQIQDVTLQLYDK